MDDMLVLKAMLQIQNMTDKPSANGSTKVKSAFFLTLYIGTFFFLLQTFLKCGITEALGEEGEAYGKGTEQIYKQGVAKGWER